MSESKTWVRIAHCRDIPLREGRAVRVGSRDIAIFNLGDRFHAVENRCPHKGGPLADGIVSGTSVVCPLHAWKMCLETGKGVNGPSASSCVETFAIRVEGGIVMLQMDDLHERPEADSDRELPEMCLQSNDVLTEYPSAAEA
jgi:nitrite reductase (NADH) small subunit